MSSVPAVTKEINEENTVFLNDNVVLFEKKKSQPILSAKTTQSSSMWLYTGKKDSCYFLFNSRIPGLITSNNAA